MSRDPGAIRPGRRRRVAQLWRSDRLRIAFFNSVDHHFAHPLQRSPIGAAMDFDQTVKGRCPRGIPPDGDPPGCFALVGMVAPPVETKGEVLLGEDQIGVSGTQRVMLPASGTSGRSRSGPGLPMPVPGVNLLRASRRRGGAMTRRRRARPT